MLEQILKNIDTNRDKMIQGPQQRCQEDGVDPYDAVTIQLGPLRATPATVETDSYIVRLIKYSITLGTGI